MAGRRRYSRKSMRSRRRSRAGSFRQSAKRVNQRLRDKRAISRTLNALSAIPTPLSGYAKDASLLANALGYGRRRSRRSSIRGLRRMSSRRRPLSRLSIRRHSRKYY